MERLTKTSLIKHNLHQIQVCLDEGNFVNIPVYLQIIKDLLHTSKPRSKNKTITNKRHK